jgi:nucleolar complex protein 3
MDNKNRIRKRKREDLVDLDPKKSELLQSHIVKEQTPKNGVTLSDLRSMPTSVVQERRLRLKIEISELAERILADPERSIMESKTFLETTTPQVVIHKPRANLLSSLQHFCGDADPVIRQLSVLSCAAVFRDLLPGYSIRVIGESEKNVRLKKEVKKLRDYESRLLLAYQKFLKLLEFLTISGEGSEKHKSKMTDFLSDSDAKVAKGLSQRDYDAAKMSQKRHQEDINLGIVHHDGDSPETLSMLGVCALSAMADLLRAAPHFNFRKNLIDFLVPRMNSKDRRLQDAACRGIEGLFSSDHSFEASLEAVQVLARCVEKYITQTENLERIFVNHPARVSPAAIRTLCSLKLTVLERMDSSLINVQKGKKSKKKMDDKATVSDIDAGLKAADAESLKERSRFAKGTLKQVVLIFFRILRSHKHSELLPPVLLGLSKFAHLLDVEIVSNLLTCLKALIRSRMQRAEGSQLDTNTKSNEEDLSAEVVLRCVLTSIRIMSGPALRVLSSDETDLTRSFYSILPQIISEDWSDIEETASSSDRESATPLALLSALCVQGLFLRKRDAVPSEMAAFAKRILSIAVSLPQGECLALVSCFRGILNRYSSTSEILSPLVSRPQVSLWGHAKSQQSTIITSDPTLSMAEGSTASFEGLNHLQMTYSKAWELGGCLLRHFHPSVVSFARSASLLEPLLPSHQPSTVHKAHNGDVTGEFNPPIQVPKRHPLAALVESSLKDETKSTGKSRLFFLRPTSREKAMFTEEDTTILDESVTDKTFRKIHRAI